MNDFTMIFSRFLLAAAMVFAIQSASSSADDRSFERTAGKLITPGAKEAIDRGLAALAARQREDGSFGSGQLRGNVAVTALAGMAFMSGGSTPGRGPHGQNVSRALDYILAHSQPNGLFVAMDATSQGPMYGHGFATLFVAECHGMSPNPRLREKLVQAVRLIVNTQNNEGGWRYRAERADADISVTICQIMALRAARNAGVHVPKKTVDLCTEYVKKCQNPDGGFRYMLQIQPAESLFPRSAAGIVALHSAGVYEGPEIDKGLAYLMRFLPGTKAAENMPHYSYGQYYAAIAMWQSGGPHWAKWYPAVRDDLLAKRSTDGTWTSDFTPDYATAMALIVLQMPNNYLPIFQR